MTIPTAINGRWTLALPPHRAARAEWRTGWEVERLASMHANLRPGMLVYDVGAEEGDLPALWASWGCDVVCVEPNERVWPNIKTCFEANGLTGRYRGGFVGLAGSIDDIPAWCKVWGEDRDDPWPFCAYGEVIGDHGFKSLADSAGVLPQVRLDTLAEAFGAPDAITMDVEGGEALVMAGAEGILGGDRPPLVWISVHPEFMFHSHATYEAELHSILHRHGYVKAHLAFDHEHHYAYWRPDVHDFALPCARHGYECP